VSKPPAAGGNQPSGPAKHVREAVK
jgi:hypothetical protein